MARRRLIPLALFVLISLLWENLPGKTPSSIVAGVDPTDLTVETADFRNRHPAAAQCASCHTHHFEEWSRSFHARSLTSADFVRVFSQYLDSLGKQAQEDAQASMACFSCHAPLLRNSRPELIRQVTAFVLASETKQLDGFEVGCVACHFNGTRTFAGPIRDPQDNPFHESRFSTSYNAPSFCADCHTWTPRQVFCSDVHSDWKESRAAKQGITCQRCHMAERSGMAAAGARQRTIHSHLFPGGRSAAMLREAVALNLKSGFRGDRLEVVATVRNRTPHGVPDG
jgi:Cytochrome c554 and c-prime